MKSRFLLTFLASTALFAPGCMPPAPTPEYTNAVEKVRAPRGEGPAPTEPGDREPLPPELTGPQPACAYIRRALAENRTVQAARLSLTAATERIPQATALEDPMVQGNVWPFPKYGPQYSLMGYNPLSVMLTQNFPWFGTLTLRGEAAEQEVKLARAELAAAELKAAEGVRHAYADLHYNERAEHILEENRGLLRDIVEITRSRYATAASAEQDVLRAEVAVSELDRELVTVRQDLTEARAMLAEEIHLDPDAPLETLPEVPVPEVPAGVEGLYRLAAANRPELGGRLAAVARDEREVGMARKKYFPNIQLGLSYMLMTTEHAASPDAGGGDNYGFTLGFNLPLWRSRLDAGLREAEERAMADAKLYEAERDATFREVKDLVARVRARRDTLELLRASILPKSEETLKAATNEYSTGTLDFVSLITAWRDLLQVRLQVVQVESELDKAVASLERAVGTRLDGLAPQPTAAEPAGCSSKP